TLSPHPPSPEGRLRRTRARGEGVNHPRRKSFARRISNMGKNKIDLNGRVAVVTGGAQGFGRAITERFVESGAKVAIWDHDQALAEKTAKEIGNAVSAYTDDVSDDSPVAKALTATSKPVGRVDILPNTPLIAHL